MTTPQPGDTTAARPRNRFRFPLLTVAVAAVVVVALWWATPRDLENAYRVLLTMLTLLLAGVLLFVWLLFLSGYRWRTRLRVGGAAILFLAAGKTMVREVEFSGDMIPTIHFLWSPSHNVSLDRFQQQQTTPSAGLPAIDLTDSAAGSFPEYRNRRRDGVVEGVSLARDWKKAPPRELWRRPVGQGYSGIAVVGNVAITLEQRHESEAIVCYDRQSGTERWLYEYPARFEERMGGDGPRATPTVVDGQVYSLGATGQLVCLDGNAGTLHWSVNILNTKGAKNLAWGMAGSPLVFDEVVVVNPGAGQGSSLVAYDRATGQERWAVGDHPAGYSSPMLATLLGRRQIVLFDGQGIAGYDDRGAGELWRFPWETNQMINVAQPVVLDDGQVFISSGYGVGSALLRIRQQGSQWSVAPPAWESTKMRCKFTSPVLYQGHLYGLDDGILACLDQESGTRKWKRGRYGHGQILLVEDLLLVLGESGVVALVQASAERYLELGRVSALTGKTWNTPALAGTQLFVRNHREMACYELPSR